MDRAIEIVEGLLAQAQAARKSAVAVKGARIDFETLDFYDNVIMAYANTIVELKAERNRQQLAELGIPELDKTED
jgi:hypothetical protein